MKGLLIIDVQNDFLPGGSLEVKGGDRIIPVINRISGNFDLVAATQDWHPAGHMSFASNHKNKKPFDRGEVGGIEQVLWPDHCVQGTAGAGFSEDLHMKPVEAIFRKGMDRDIDSYSGFYDNGHKKPVGLSGYLKSKGVRELFISGLAGDVCVYFTLKDALEEGFRVWLIEDATQALDPEKFEEQKTELRNLGAGIVQSRVFTG